ncbi:MAG: hypothetical protein WBF90_19805 [Rivularia sp. (in: cyanobacteria)]
MHQNILLYVPNEQLGDGIYVETKQNNVRGTIPWNGYFDWSTFILLGFPYPFWYLGSNTSFTH